MTLLTDKMLLEIAGVRYRSGNRAKNQPKIIKSTVRLVNEYASIFDLDDLLNLSRFLGQTCVESAYFSTTTEFASGAAYEGRRDLGNTEPGDGRRYKGHGLIQTTGRYNTTKFNSWAKSFLSDHVSESIPDFVKTPKALADFPWAFFSAAYYWDRGNPTNRSLNRLAQEGNDEMITRRINGGLNHFAERLEATDRVSLVLLGFATSKSGIRGFQEGAGIVVDGVIGPQTRAALISALKSASKPASKPAKTKSEVAKREPSNLLPSTVLDSRKPKRSWLAALIDIILGVFRR